MSYILHYDLGDFITQTDGAGPIYVQDYTETHYTHSLPSMVTTVLTATYRDAGGTIHVARIIVERASLLAQDARPLHTAVHDRMLQARDALVAALSVTRTRILGGILAAPGLMDDLKLVHTSHDLWRLAEAASRDVCDRTLVLA